MTEQASSPQMAAADVCGSGVVPMRAMLRHHRATASQIAARLLYSARARDDLIYGGELEEYDTVITLTDEQPQDWNGRTGRIDSEFLAESAWPPAERPLVYICGPTRIRTERFGPT